MGVLLREVRVHEELELGALTVDLIFGSERTRSGGLLEAFNRGAMAACRQLTFVCDSGCEEGL
jgi:hypothetical protein